MERNEHIEITDGLLLAYVNEELTTVQQEAVEAWLYKSTENKVRLEELKKTWEMSGSIDPKPVLVDADDAWEKVKGRINDAETPVVPINRTKKQMYWGVAAMIVVLLGVFSILKMTSGIEQITVVAEVSGLVDELEDGSVVTLNANTSLVYPEAFGDDERRVELKGEAFFDIERNEEKPFIIELPQENYVKVLGTSFNIKANENDSLIEVYVHTGKVEFGQEGNTILLEAGQIGVMNTVTNEVRNATKETVAPGAQELFWREGVQFDGVPMNDVAAILSEIFEVEIRWECSEGKLTDRFLPEHSLEEIFTVLELNGYQSTKVSNKVYILKCDD